MKRERLRRGKRQEMTIRTRMEADSIGTLEVPEGAYYGVQTLRAKQNPVFIKNLAQVKKAAAVANRNAMPLSQWKH